MRYFNRVSKTEAIEGVHDISSPDIVLLPDDNLFFQSLPEGKQIVYDTYGLPSHLEDVVYVLTEADYAFHIQTSVLNAKAKELGYDSIHTAVTYADEPAVSKFQTEGIALRAWRSLVWEKAYEVLAAFTAGEIEQPTLEELVAELPDCPIRVES